MKPSTLKKLAACEAAVLTPAAEQPSDNVKLAITNADGTTYDFAFTHPADENLDLQLLLRNAEGTYDYVYSRGVVTPGIPLKPAKHLPVVAIKNNTTYFCKIIQFNGDALILFPTDQSASSAYTICTVKFFQTLDDAKKDARPRIVWSITNMVMDDTSPDETRCKIAVSRTLDTKSADIILRLCVDGMVTEKESLEWSYKSGTVGTVLCDFEPSTSQ